MEGAGSGGQGDVSFFVVGRPGHVINPLQKRVMTSQVAVIARPQRLHQTGEK